jgi:hypothetical protein
MGASKGNIFLWNTPNACFHSTLGPIKTSGLSQHQICPKPSSVLPILLNMAPLTDPKLDKISQGQPGLWRAFFNRRNIAGVAGTLLFGPGLQLGKTGAVAGFLLVRWVYSKTEQFVPFTKRRHNVLLPSVAGMYGNVRSPADCACA